MGKKAFITGITGQDGSYLAELLPLNGSQHAPSQAAFRCCEHNDPGSNPTIESDGFQKRTYLFPAKEECEGRDLNPRTPLGTDLESVSLTEGKTSVHREKICPGSGICSDTVSN